MKIPVSDVPASIKWYRQVLGLEVVIEFTEDGELRGVALDTPAGTTPIALRHDPERPPPSPVSISSRWVSRPGTRPRLGRPPASIGQQHGGIVTGHRGGAVLVGLHDPDGIELRLYAD